MKFQKLLLTSAVCAALGGVSVTTQAAITAVPGEAAIVPFVTTDGSYNSGYHETYVTLRVPASIGSDTVINYFTAPNTTSSSRVTRQLAGGTPREPEIGQIHWFLKDSDSNEIQNGTCEVSAGDVVIWTTDEDLRYYQAEYQDYYRAYYGTGFNGPSSLCGPTARPALAYVVFETQSGATGQDADFAFTGNAFVDAYYLSYGTYPVFSVPFVPMADGADPATNCGQGNTTAQPEIGNEVITGTGACVDPGVPLRYAPIAAGIRMNNADGVTGQIVKTQMEIAGPNDDNYDVGYSNPTLHVHWFDRKDASRVSFGNIWDDQEGACSDRLPLPYELNAHLYNVSISIDGGFGPNPYNFYDFYNAETEFEDGKRTDLNAIFYRFDALNGYSSGSYATCAPYWQMDQDGGYGRWPGTFMGYREGEFVEINSPEPAPGKVNSASIQFSAIGTYIATYAWRSHLATELGIWK